MRDESSEIVGAADLGSTTAIYVDSGNTQTTQPNGNVVIIEWLAPCSASLPVDVKPADFYTVVMPDGASTTLEATGGDLTATFGG